MLSERDILKAIFVAIIGIGEKLTGQRMTVHIATEAGDMVGIGGGEVTWGSHCCAIAPAAEVAERFAHSAQLHAKH